MWLSECERRDLCRLHVISLKDDKRAECERCGCIFDRSAEGGTRSIKLASVRIDSTAADIQLWLRDKETSKKNEF